MSDTCSLFSPFGDPWPSCLLPSQKESYDQPGSSDVKASACNAGDLGSIPGSGRFPWRRKWQPTPVFLPGESQGRGSRWAAVHWVAQSRTRLKRLSSSSSSNLCKQNYLYGILPFYKIQVNHFMAWDESSGAKIIPKCILWVRGLVPF